MSDAWRKAGLIVFYLAVVVPAGFLLWAWLIRTVAQ